MTTTQIVKNSTGLHIEGNLIAGDYLADLVTGSIKGQSPEDFGFAKADKLADEIATVWGEAKKFWAGFKKSREESSFSESGTTETRKAWVVPLLYNLGYLPSFRGEVEVIDGQSFAISHRAGMPSPPSPLSQKGRGGERESEILSPSPRGRGARGEGEPPIHITGCRIRLDHKPPSGNPRLSAHGLMQEYLNRTEHLWGITTNGLQWRLLRDSSLMTRLTYIEFDLEQILEGENFADFGLFYRLFHRSRLPIGMDDAHECLLEFYHQETLQQGGRVRDRLRDGVERAIAQLGNGFLQHPKNQALRDALTPPSPSLGEGGRGDEGKISDRDFYRQILLLIYRLLFLMVAESRNLLLTGEDPEKVRIYEEYYSIERLRALAEKAIVPRREGFQDLWQGLRVTFCLFDENWRGELLGLSPLNGDLFGSTTLPELNVSALDNYDLMVVIRNLSLYAPTDKAQLRRVNYAALDVEELGSVYESLLDFHPQVSLPPSPPAPLPRGEGRNWEFLLVAGSDRKTTGAYYTPSELVAQLVKSALEPVIAERMNEAKNSLTPQPPLPRGEGEQDEFQNPSPSGRGAGVRDSWEISDDLRKKMQDVARQFRKEPTQSEAILWEAIRNRKLENRKFRRQHPIGTFIVDFFCREENLIVEVDGLIHESQQELDRQRQGLLESLGLHFVRVSSQQVETSLFETLETIKQSFLLPSPSGRGAGGEGLQQLQESALLSIKVCDPACGSGHFLLAAARRIGKELAKVRTGEAAPSPEPLREATRDVIQHCIYGVDINPLAVDLCKVALWIEGFAKGMPLNFLDHRIKCGNSLVGVLNLDVLKEGIPDEAFKAVTGDDKALSSIKKKANKQERLKDLKGQLSTAGQLDDDLAEIASAWQELDRIPENTPEFVKQKKERYEANQRDRKWWRSRSACNLWTAAFFMPLTEQNLQLLPTTAALVRLLNEEISSPPSPLSQKGRGGTGTEENLAPLSPLGRGAGGEGLPAIGIRDIVDAANQLASEKGFFHWALEFPDVFDSSPRPLGEGQGVRAGFDCILGNPPWERIKLQEKEFFASRDAEIAKAANKSEREKLIKTLPTRKPELAREFEAAKHDAEAQSKFIRESNRFPLTAVGDVNTYAVFSIILLKTFLVI
jgi:very-short-patch-repair endonuclease